MKAYKLTDKNNQTKNDTQWGKGITHTVQGDDSNLCSSSWIHFYTNPHIAIIMNPIHVNFNPFVLWECETSGEEKHEQLKSGCKSLTTIRIIDAPVITINQKIAFGILCAQYIYKNPDWNKWANNWLNGSDRSYAAATYVADAAYAAADATHAVSNATYGTYAAVYATHAVSNAAYTTYSADAAAYAAVAAYAAADAVIAAHAVAAATADAAAAADCTNHSIDFIKLAEKAMTYK
jgi:hypothetical protein